jgi:Fic family protein
MAHVVKEFWTPDGSGVTRRDRAGCEYEAYVPDLLRGRPFLLEGAVAADVADAEAAIARLNLTATTLVDTEALARLLLRAEAVASSRIEGLEIGARRLLEAEASLQWPTRGRSDVTAEEVLGNIDAMSAALAAADTREAITVDTILEVHRRLMAGTRLAEHAGRLRGVQNWIGGSAYNPCAAAFVPPPASQVPGLMADLAAFCNSDSLPAVVQAAIAHAQFETIHPFVDGNGRVGRALIHMVLRRRGLAPRVVPPVSLVLATLSSDYVGALTAYRHLGDPASEAATAGVNRWVALFAGSCTRAVEDSSAFEQRIADLQHSWRERLAPVRRGSAVDLLIRSLPGCPIVTVTGVARMLDRTFRAAGGAVEALERAGVLRQVSIGTRNRAFEAAEVIDEFTRLERRLASPDGDTRVSRPVRPAPGRK